MHLLKKKARFLPFRIPPGFPCMYTLLHLNSCFEIPLSWCWHYGFTASELFAIWHHRMVRVAKFGFNVKLKKSPAVSRKPQRLPRAGWAVQPLPQSSAGPFRALLPHFPPYFSLILVLHFRLGWTSLFLGIGDAAWEEMMLQAWLRCHFDLHHLHSRLFLVSCHANIWGNWFPLARNQVNDELQVAAFKSHSGYPLFGRVSGGGSLE